MDLKVGIVGFGKMGMLHGALSNSINGMNLIAITEKSRLVGMGSKAILKNVKVYNDYKKMIDKNFLDILIITTPTFNHLEVAEYGVKSKISLFIEKPLARNIKEAEYLMNITRNNKIISMVGFNYRYLPSVIKGKELLSSGILGSIKKVKACLMSGDVLSIHKGWRFNPEISGGGVLIDLGIHLIDILYWFFGNVKSVIANSKKVYSKNVEDEFFSNIIFYNGINVDFETSWSREQYRKPSLKLQIEGDEGYLIITEQTVEIFNDKLVTIMTEPDLYMGTYIDIGGISYSLQMKTFYESIITKNECETNITSAYYIHKIIHNMYQSAKNNQEIIYLGTDNE